MSRRASGGNKDQIDLFMQHGLDLDSRTIFISGEVSEQMADGTMKALHLLNQASSTLPVRIYLNSDGGSYYDGMAIYGFIKSMPYHVTILCYGRVMSAASIILQAADNRLLDSNCVVMVHHGTDGSSDQHVIDYERWAEVSKYNRKQMCSILAERSPRDASYWQRKCMHDYIMTAEEAVAEGLADGVIW